MNEKDFQSALHEMRQQSKQRRFVQSVELIVNFMGVDFKKAANQIDEKVMMPFATGKKAAGKSILFAKDKAFIEKVKAEFDRVITEAEIPKLGKKDIAQIVNDFDVLLAEGPVMIAVGKHLGQQLAPKGKMPKPVPPNPAAVSALLSQSGNVTRATNKKGKFMPVIQVVIGNEKMQDEELAANASAIVSALLPKLPQRQGNIKSVFVKESMGPPIRIGKKEAAE